MKFSLVKKSSKVDENQKGKKNILAYNKQYYNS